MPSIDLGEQQVFPLRNQFFPVVDENDTDNYKGNRSCHFVHCAISFLGTCLPKNNRLPAIGKFLVYDKFTL